MLVFKIVRFKNPAVRVNNTVCCTVNKPQGGHDPARRDPFDWSGGDKVADSFQLQSCVMGEKVVDES